MAVHRAALPAPRAASPKGETKGRATHRCEIWIFSRMHCCSPRQNNEWGHTCGRDINLCPQLNPSFMLMLKMALFCQLVCVPNDTAAVQSHSSSWLGGLSAGGSYEVTTLFRAVFPVRCTPGHCEHFYPHHWWPPYGSVQASQEAIHTTAFLAVRKAKLNPSTASCLVLRGAYGMTTLGWGVAASCLN